VVGHEGPLQRRQFRVDGAASNAAVALTGLAGLLLALVWRGGHSSDLRVGLHLLVWVLVWVRVRVV